MKKIGFLSKIVYFLNILVGLLLLISYFVPMIYPGSIPFVSTLSLLMPVLIILNILFVIYWLLRVNIRFLFSLFVILLGFKHLGNLFRWSNSEYIGSEDVRVMTFNVRMFNVYDWIDGVDEHDIYDLVKNESPDIVAFQEYHPMKNFAIGNYKYEYLFYPNSRKYWGQAIYSKYPIKDKGSVQFPSSANSAIYVDVSLRGRMVRVYSVHLETLSLDKKDLQLDKTFDISDSTNNIKENVKSLATKLEKGFGRHGEQADILRQHIDSSPYPVIVMGDFNSSAFSYEYSVIKGNLEDAFEYGGVGFGKTYDFKFFPLRIDFILGDPNFRVVSFKTYNEKKLSDHYAVSAAYNIP